MITRKTFLVALAGGGVAATLPGCGGGGGDDVAAPAAGCRAFTFSDNHGHLLVLSAADLDSTQARTFSVQGSAPHNHDVTLSPAQLAALKAGQAVSALTTMDGLTPHTHALGGACA